MNERSEISIYPVTAVNDIKISGIDSEVYSLRIYNAVGEMVKIINNVSAGERIPVNDLPGGVYMIHVNNTIQYRIIKFTKSL